VEAAFVVENTVPDQLDDMATFSEQLVVIAPASHPKIRRAQDVHADTIISFPYGCAYRRRLQAWLADGSVTPDKVLELSSYHAIVACVASGTGIAFAPRSVLDTLRATQSVAVYPLKQGSVNTCLVWRKGEPSSALRALHAEVAALRKKRKLGALKKVR
jgi:DNA-binding transcriptional LysR family regulator